MIDIIIIFCSMDIKSRTNLVKIKNFEDQNGSQVILLRTKLINLEF